MGLPAGTIKFLRAAFCLERVSHDLVSLSCEHRRFVLYSEYFSKSTQYEGCLKKYKDAASSRTRSESQRVNRLQALREFCDVTTDYC